MICSFKISCIKLNSNGIILKHTRYRECIISSKAKETSLIYDPCMRLYMWACKNVWTAKG